MKQSGCKFYLFSKKIFTLVLFLFVINILPSNVGATPDYASSTGKSCVACHIESYGGELNDAGRDFKKTTSADSGYRSLSEGKKPVRLLVGLVHIIAGFLWFGTILYVHIILKPAYAKRGLPRSEVRLGIICMILVGISGVLLTVSRIENVSVLFSTTWGAVLLVKIVVYLVMVTSAAFVVLFIGPRLRREKTDKGRVFEKPEDGVYCHDTLAYFNGVEGRDCYFAYNGKVYDATSSKFWKDGKHMKHHAGTDLTKFLAQAPHGVENVMAMEVVGTYDVKKEPPKTIYQKIFYVIAYMNLTLVFVVIGAIAYWNWGL